MSFFVFLVSCLFSCKLGFLVGYVSISIEQRHSLLFANVAPCPPQHRPPSQINCHVKKKMFKKRVILCYMSDCLIVQNDTRKSMFPPDTPCSQWGHDCWMETWLSSFHKFCRASLYRERRQTSPSWHRWNSISEQLPAKISRWISSRKGKTTFKYLYCSFLKWTFEIWRAGLFSCVTREKVTECTLFWCSFVLCSRGDISYETCSLSSLHSLQVFFRAKSNKNVSVICDPKCFNTRLRYMCCSDSRFRYEMSARVTESAATDSEGSVYEGFDGFNHSNYTTSLTPNYAQSAFSRRAAILHVKRDLHFSRRVQQNPFQDAAAPKRLVQVTSSREQKPD